MLYGLGEPRDIGRALLEQGWMTAFQVNQVHRGQGKTLMVGPYLLLERLGKGGMGEVFKARHLRMCRTVALKLVRPGRRPRTLARLLREMEAAARLDHPNVVRAYDAGEAGSYDGTVALWHLRTGKARKRLVPGVLIAAATRCRGPRAR